MLLFALPVAESPAGIQFQAVHYKTEDGLPTNLTKAILQDEQGYLWTATDAGLVRYDGRRFANYGPHLPSELVKDIVQSRDGRQLYVVTDGGITVFSSGIDGAADVQTIVAGGAELDERTLQFPKTVYEDLQGRLWFSERQAVTLLQEDGELKRYWFGEEDLSESLGRSFLFAEDDKGRLFVSSQRGRLFIYDEAQDAFRRLELKGGDAVTNIFALLPLKGNVLLLGSNDGIFRVALDDLDAPVAEFAYALSLVSSLAMDTRGILYAGTWRTGIHFVDTNIPDAVFQRIENWEYNVINDLEVGREGRTLWVSSDQGMGFLEPSFFSRHQLPEAGFNIGLFRKRSRTVLASDMLRIFEVRQSDREFVAEEVYEKAAPDSHMGAFAADENRFVVGFNGFFQVVDHEKMTRYELPGSWFVKHVYIDRRDNVWLAPQGVHGLARLTPENDLVYYLPETGMPGEVHGLAEGLDGTLYACADGAHFLYSYDARSDVFHPLPMELPQELNAGAPLRTFGLDEDQEGVLWLATNRGLLRAEKGKLLVPEQGDPLLNRVIKSVAVDSARGIWAGTDAGLFLWTPQGLVHFDGQDGLPSVSINYHGLFLDHDRRLWVGTTNGLASIQDTDEPLAKTPAPRFTALLRDGAEPVPMEEGLVLPHHSFLEGSVIAVSFPGDRVRYEKMLMGQDEDWRSASPDAFRTLKLAKGDYVLQVRAQQKGRLPSDVTSIPLRVAAAWYVQWWAFLLYFCSLGALVALVQKLRTTRMEREQAEEALEVKKERYQLVALGSNDGMWDWDLRENTVFYSPRWKEMIDCGEDEIGESPGEWFDRVHPDDRENVNREIALHREGVTPHLQVEYRMRRKDDSWRWVLTRGVAVRGEDGKAYRMAGSQTDITGHKEGQEALLHASLHDPLTGLPNRTLFRDRLESAIIRGRRHPNYLFALLFLDLNKFKEINDTLGHMAGDELLKELARRLQERMREGDTVARFGGDEFAILLDDVRTAEDAHAIAARFGTRIKEPAQIFQHNVSVSASIGVAVWNGEFETADQVLSNADSAMYIAKKKSAAELETMPLHQ